MRRRERERQGREIENCLLLMKKKFKKKKRKL
jgi:hypothetical protein